MKRDPALVPLSHDHLQALFQAMRMKRAVEDDRAEVVEGVLEFWRTRGALSLRITEELLLPVLARHCPPDDERVVRVLVDHLFIRERMACLEGGAQVEELNRFGERLEEAIRHQERTLFPLIETAMDDAELSELGERIKAAKVE